MAKDSELFPEIPETPSSTKTWLEALSVRLDWPFSERQYHSAVLSISSHSIVCVPLNMWTCKLLHISATGPPLAASQRQELFFETNRAVSDLFLVCNLQTPRSAGFGHFQASKQKSVISAYHHGYIHWKAPIILYCDQLSGYFCL